MLKFLKRHPLMLIVAIVTVLSLTICMNALSQYFRGRNESKPSSKSWVNVGRKDNFYDSSKDFDNFDNEIGAPGGEYIVPNIVHFIRWNKPFTFVEAVCLLAAVKNQNPDKVYIHGDGKVLGKYWDMAMSFPRMKEVVEPKYLKRPRKIFGQELRHVFHASDVARIYVLMSYGGIFLDNDSFLVRNLDEFRKFEMTLGWVEGEGRMANQGIVAHKNARFLRKWLESYRGQYCPKLWIYNTMVRPVQTILKNESHLIHRVKHLWAEDHIGRYLYLENRASWRNHYIIHLSVSYWVHQGFVQANLSSAATYPIIFDENNIKNYNCTFRDMVHSVYPLLPEIRDDATTKLYEGSRKRILNGSAVTK